MSFAGRRAALAVAALATCAGFLAVASVSAAASGAPYTDPNVVGSIGLCDQNGQPLSHGDLETRPFVWKAVGATAGPTPFNQTGATAQLFAFQARKGVDPGDWSGEQLSGASRFTNLAHPTAALTGLDESLAVDVAHYPPQWDGYIQLRLYLNAPNAGEYTSTYNALNLVVKGSTWSVVGGDALPSCGGSTAVSDKEVTATNSAAAASLTTQTLERSDGSAPSASKQATHASNGTGGATDAAQPGAVASHAGGVVPAPSGSPAIGGSPAASGSTVASAGSGGHGSGSHTLLLILIVIAVLGAGFFGIQWVRSRT